MDMKELELPLVFFTVLAQTGIGMAIFAALRDRKALPAMATSRLGVGGRGSTPVNHEWSMVFALLSLGTFAAFFHLGKPLGVFRILDNVAVSWFSREILTVGIFSGLAGLMMLLRLGKAPAFLQNLDQRLVGGITAIAGLLAVLAMGVTYAWTGIDPIHNIIPTLFFLLTTAILGTAFTTYFTRGEALESARQALRSALITGLVVHVSVPLIWISGGTLMRNSGTRYLESPVHWFHILVLCLGLYAIRNKTVPKWLPPLLLIGELAGRLAVFMLVMPSRANIGNLY